MQKTLKELDKILAFMIKNQKKGQEVYFEEIVELIQPVENSGYVFEVLNKLISLGYIGLNKDTNNYFATLDGKIFFENSKSGTPFSDQMHLSVGKEKSTVLVNNNISAFHKITLAAFFVVTVLLGYFIYTNQLMITSLEQDLEVKDSLISGLEEENRKISTDFTERFEKNEKSIGWHQFKIKELEGLLKKEE